MRFPFLNPSAKAPHGDAEGPRQAEVRQLQGAFLVFEKIKTAVPANNMGLMHRPKDDCPLVGLVALPCWWEGILNRTG